MSTENEASGAISTQDGALEMTLGRLSSKPGVLAAMAIDRTTATVLATSGNTSVFSLSSTSTPANSSLSPVGLASPVSDFAAMVWRHVQTTVHLVQAMDTEDDLRLLRLRTKRVELLIIPDPKYIFVVAHEVPNA